VIKRLYNLCLAAGPTRRLVRGMRGRLYGLLSVPEANHEISTLAQTAGATLFLDIGCFQGNTILRFRETGIHCPIVGFDPLEENIQIAARRLKAYDDIQLITAAVSNVEGAVDFFFYSGLQTSSFLDNDEGNTRFLTDETKHERQVVVKTITLDAWGRATKLDPTRTVIKCDVQGAELHVIQGGKRFFSDHVIGFYAEVQLCRMYRGQPTFEELNRVLEGDHDLVLHNIYRCLHDAEGRVLQTDALWIKRSFLGKMQI
jgi:FkbM family methyltransferase